MSIFTVILVQPLINLLALAYHVIPDIGVVIILLTLLIRLLLAPSFHKSLHSQRQLQNLQPKMNDIRERYKNDKEAQAKAMMDLYKEHKVNPLGSCLPLLIQLPILIALYKVFIVGLGGQAVNQYLYSFVPNPGAISPYFLHLIDLAKPNIIFGILAGAAQFIQSKMMMPAPGANADATTKALSMQTVYVLPVLTILISLRLPAGLPLYWIVTTLFAIGQQLYIIKNNPAQVPQIK